MGDSSDLYKTCERKWGCSYEWMLARYVRADVWTRGSRYSDRSITYLMHPDRKPFGRVEFDAQKKLAPRCPMFTYTGLAMRAGTPREASNTGVDFVEIVQILKAEALELLSLQENHFRDFKAKEIKPAKLTRSVSSFANSSGGELYVGIRERANESEKEREWDGFVDQEAANAIIQTLEAMSPLGSHYNAEFLRCDGLPGLVLKLLIQKTREIILSSEGVAYVRKSAQNLPVEAHDALERLRLDKGINSFEDQTVPIAPTEISNSITIIEFMLSEIPTADPDKWLRSQLLIANDKPTVAGTLLFSDQPQAALPKRSAVKIFQYRSREEGVDRETLAFTPITIEGPLYDVIKEAVAETKRIVESIKRLGERGLEAISYPDVTLHEVITNAVLHRDYSIPVDSQIRIYDDRVEIESPGKLPGHVTVRNILDSQFARNPKIVRLINKFPDPPNQDVGEGLNSAFDAMRKIRLKDPQISELENSVLVQIWHERLSSPAQIVMEYLETHGTITNAIGREITGIRRDVQMKDIFVALRKSGQLEQVPGTRGRASVWRKSTR
jgi:ATP-dependent DNA helicase RecG